MSNRRTLYKYPQLSPCTHYDWAVAVAAAAAAVADWAVGWASADDR